MKSGELSGSGVHRGGGISEVEVVVIVVVIVTETDGVVRGGVSEGD